MRPLPDKTILVTGATDGHGQALATELAAAGCTVLIHGRDDDRGQQTIDRIRERTGNDQLHWVRADLSSLQETATMAEQLIARHDRLDALVNNAGIGTTTDGEEHRMESRDGYELRFAVNYLAGYLLTRLLLPLLRSTAPARIVNVASAGQAPIDFDDLMLEHGYDGVRAYGQSKLAQIMLTLDLADELDGTGVTANCLHPASYMPTKIVRADGIEPISTLQQGVQATLRLVTDPELNATSGAYFDGLQPATPHAQATDERAREQLRDLSERMCNVARTARTR